VVWVLSILLLVSLYVIFNLLKKLEQLESANEEYSDWIEQFYIRLNTILAEIKAIDEKKLFQTDDEVGSVFSQISETIKKLESGKKASKKEIGNLKRKLTISKKKTQKMQEVYDNDEVESAEDFLRKFAKSK